MTTVCPGGGASSAKPISPAVGFFTGAVLQSILVDVLSLSEPWAALLVYAAGQTIDTGPFCATDPPTPTYPDAADIAAILTFDPINSPAAAVKLTSVVQNALWYYLCQCNGAATQPTAPVPPSYPSTGPVVNPPGSTPPTAGPCSDMKWAGPSTEFVVDPNGLKTGLIFPSVNANGRYTLPPGVSNMVVTCQAFNDGATSSGFMDEILRMWDASNNLVGQTNMTTGLPGTAARVFPITIPATAVEAGFLFGGSEGHAGQDNTISFECSFYCGGSTPTVPVTPCCPPDPLLQSKLDLVLSYLQSIYAGLPTQLNSYASGTVHAGLSGNGHITLVEPHPLAIIVNITTDPANLGTEAGDPTALFDRGFIVPVVNAAPVAAANRLRYNPQLFVLPDLTEQVGYSLHPGVVVSITELVRGP